MRKKKHVARARRFCARCRPLSTRFSLTLCIGQALALLSVVVSIVCWPFRKFSAYAKATLKPYPRLHCLYSHSVVCCLGGMIVLAFSFALSEWSNKVLWKCTIETSRALGVCPIYESIVSVAKFGEDITNDI